MTRALGGPPEWSSLRPEALRIVPPEGAGLSGPVTALRYLGAGSRVTVAVAGVEVAALVPSGQALPAVGAVVGLAFDPPALHVMGPAG